MSEDDIDEGALVRSAETVLMYCQCGNDRFWLNQNQFIECKSCGSSVAKWQALDAVEEWTDPEAQR